jgi:hypothetical protein
VELRTIFWGEHHDATFSVPRRFKVREHFGIKSRDSGMFLDVSGESKEEGGAVIQWGFHGNANQLWKLVEVK